jgi:hypothetical protein
MVGMSVPKDPSVKGLVPRVVLSGDGGILRSGAYWEVFRSVGNALKGDCGIPVSLLSGCDVSSLF